MTTTPWIACLVSTLALALASCGSKPPVAPRPVDVDAAEERTAETIEQLRESAVALEYSASDAPTGARRMASGVVISDDGDVLSIRIDPPTSNSPVLARDAQGRRLPARWVAADSQTGLTLLKIAPGHARPAVPSPKGPRLGGQVFLIGNPFGLGHSVSRGSISGLNRRVELGRRQLGGLIQVDVPLHPGDSGALLADLHGGWLGVIRSDLAAPNPEKDKGKSTREHDHDLGFAISALDALWVAGQLLAHQKVDRAYLGVTMHEPVARDDPELDGVVLEQVLDGTPAGRSGLKSGDRLVALNDQRVRIPTDLTDRLDRLAANLDVTLDYIPGSGPDRERKRMTIRTGSRPPAETKTEPSSNSAKVSPPSPAPTPKPRQKPDLPREVAEKIERLERRIDEMEKREAAAMAVTPQP